MSDAAIDEMLAGLLDAPGGVISSDETAAGPIAAPWMPAGGRRASTPT